MTRLLEKRVFQDGKEGLPYRLLKPAEYERTKRYPLVILLHGAGERGTDNGKQLVHGVREFAKPSARKEYPCFLIAPQCPDGKRWVEVDWSAPSHTMPKDPSDPARLVLALIAAVKKEFAIDSKRIYLTGLSMGGFGTWDLIARKPKLFAAALPVCGGGDPRTAKKILHIPIWAFHGDRDTAVIPERSREMVAALKKAGGQPRYTEYKGVGHDSWTRTYRDPAVLRWLFEQRQE
jgi:predicted peptidase